MGIILYLLFGPIVWVLHLTITYAVQSTVCALGSSARALLHVDLVPFAVFIATALALAILAAAMCGLVPVMRKPGKAEEPASTRFFERTMRLLCLLGAIGVVWGAVSAFTLDPCAPLR